VIFGALLLFPFIFGQHWLVNIGIFTLMYAALATSWNLLGGYAGYLSLGHAAFFGLGAYAIGILFTHVSIGAGYTPFFVLPAVGIVVAIISIPIAWVALRVRAATFAIVTISLLFVVQQLAFNLHGITHGSQGLTVPIPRFPTATYERPFYLGMLAVLAVAMLACWYVRDSKLGLMLFAIRDDEDRVRGLGVQVTTAKVLAFLGGKGTLWGPMLGAFILVPTQQYLAYRLGASELYLVGYAAVFLAIMLALPRGVLPSLQDRLAHRASRRAAPPSVSAEAPGRAPQVVA
jgi:branched-chain amino acid transport system permease protein